ncbi:MAG: hypothetical protein B1H08_00035 [Candidatus Omnitrophica bacterium 4484_171]|nr:MAG: hypothetical protein B1H08_00035 [Candidatus Omnitrophica bacterium 4484_171]
MSIIYDALNKAEKENNNIHNKQSPKPNRRFIITGIAVLIIILILSVIFLNNKKVHVSQIKSRRETVRRHVKFVEKKYSPGSLVLEGIIYDKGVPTAVINGKVLAEGGKISGFRVDKISKDSVQLFDSQDDRKITLSFQ